MRQACLWHPIRPQVVRGDRPEAAIADVILARPQHLHRLAGVLCQQDGVDDELLVAMAPPAEAAAHQIIVELDLIARNAEHLGGGLDREALALRAAPQLHRVACWRNRGDCVERLHLRVVGIVAAVFALDHGGDFFEGAGRVADLLSDLHRIDDLAMRDGFVGLECLVAVETLRLAGGRPSDVQCILRGECSPRRFGHHADAEWKLDDLDDAGDRARPHIVDAVGAASLDRGAQHRAVQHAGNLHIDAVLRRAVDLVR